ncbi:MAG TPA: aldo/keto reductase [Spirochaetia bacterium]|nr:aldo/keto reductase [Spirochaetia bacterium]
MHELIERRPLGTSGLDLPPVVFGTSALGNLYIALDPGIKRRIASEWFSQVKPPVALDTAGKYGAGLALEMIGRLLRDLGVAPQDVVISNKLGWKRVPLVGAEPTFEPGVWKDLEYDAEQAISYRGMKECWEQGCKLLGEPYRPKLVSVHDPDEYIGAAIDSIDRARRVQDVLEAYRALGELKQAGEVAAVGIGAKDWKIIREVSRHVELDWVMFACSLTMYTHPKELLEFIDELRLQGVGIINSAVFNAGFLTGGRYFDYRIPDPVEDAALFSWRERFLALCERHRVKPSDACVEFGLSAPGVSAVALNTSNPDHVLANVQSVVRRAPREFWSEAKADNIIDASYPYPDQE